eukprot:134843-Pyramimonas_sp.AAC.1
MRAHCWGRVARARVDRQLEGAPNEAPCAICRGVGLIAAEFHDALAGEHDAVDRQEEILYGANEFRDFRA